MNREQGVEKKISKCNLPPSPIPHSPSPFFDILVAEIGSTTTLVNAFCGIDSGEPGSETFWGQGQAATSVAEGDVW
ncbi:MAG: glutamate mutase L [Spirochaetaceae bacterium]|jgi:hypothetical protein|nr:glutamate mutase L [Spirochaetaceae bacterium]